MIREEVGGGASEASKPSAGASWQRPAIGRPTSASYENFKLLNYKGNIMDKLVTVLHNHKKLRCKF